MKLTIITAALIATFAACSRDPAAPATCSLLGTWHYSAVGLGDVTARRAVLAPPARLSVQVSGSGSTTPEWECTSTVPGCQDVDGDDGGTVAMVTTADVNHAFEDPDVLAAFTVSPAASPLLFGRDLRLLGSPLFEVGRDSDARGFLVGAPCPEGAGGTSCTPIPEGLARLRSLVQSLDAQQLTGDCTLPD